jgi:hypothetical protein
VDWVSPGFELHGWPLVFLGLKSPSTLMPTVSGMSPRLEDGWKSFPSGHSSSNCMPNTFQRVIYHSSDEYEVSFAGLGFLAFYLAGKSHLFDNRGHAVSPHLLCGKSSAC